MVECCGRGRGWCYPFGIGKDADYGWGMSREYVLQPFRAPILRWENDRECRCRGVIQRRALFTGPPRGYRASPGRRRPSCHLSCRRLVGLHPPGKVPPRLVNLWQVSSPSRPLRQELVPW